ncbi:MAG: S-methyl-5'-thioadenosine phosphorylase [Candidatus Omnitrophota bacterium]
MTELKPKVGIIGGSGLYDIEGFTDRTKISVNTPFGKPSDDFVVGRLNGVETGFLARHAVGHKLLPGEINYRANIYAFKVLGVEKIISVSAVGSFKAELKPLDIVVVDQFIDRTNQARTATFFGKGIAAHVSFSEPVCAGLRKMLCEAGKELNLRIHNGGTYVNMEGPAFSTKAESLLYKSWGADVIGMTNMTEARLAREAEICYATLAFVTDYDCWYEGEEEVSVEMVVQNLFRNADNAKNLLKKAVSKVAGLKPGCKCAEALKNAVITQKDLIPSDVREALKPIIGKYL